MWNYFLPAAAVHVFELLLVRFVLTDTNRSPAASVAWILGILFVPFLGPLAFLVFGMTRVESRRRRRIEADREMEERLGHTASEHVVDADGLAEPGRQLAVIVKLRGQV